MNEGPPPRGLLFIIHHSSFTLLFPPPSSAEFSIDILRGICNVISNHAQCKLHWLSSHCINKGMETRALQYIIYAN